MPEQHAGIVIGEGIRYTALHDSKFRSCLLTLQFYVRRSRETAPLHALLPDLLTASSAAYPSGSAMTLRLESLYAADFFAKLTLCGDAAALEFTASWLDDRYALEQESLTDEMLDLITGALLHPNAENGAFRNPEFRICLQNLLDDIDCEQNDKRSYALRRAAETAFCNETAAIPATGFRAEAERAAPEQAYQIWQEILRTARIEIAAVTPEPKPQIAEQLRAAFSTLERKPDLFPFPAPSPLKTHPQTVTEGMPVGQTKLVLMYKYDAISYEILLMLCSLLGWISDSLLYTHLREEQSLCYYCLLQASVFKQTLFIDSGIDSADLDAVCRTAAEQIDALCSGTFTDDMMEKAVLRYADQAAAASDSAGDAAQQILSSLRHNDPRTPQEITEALRQITRQQIMDAAAKLRLDSVYVLCAEREEAEPDAP